MGSVWVYCPCTEISRVVAELRVSDGEPTEKSVKCGSVLRGRGEMISDWGNRQVRNVKHTSEVVEGG